MKLNNNILIAVLSSSMLLLANNNEFSRNKQEHNVLNLNTSPLLEITEKSEVVELAGGPSQPELSSASSSQPGHQVDPFSGDFSYTINLGDVGGYPLTISYSSGRQMEEEASMVGLGWNFNLGAINRNVNGIPDDFKGDEVKYQTHFDGYNEIGFGQSFTTGEIFGFGNLNLSSGYNINYNSKFGFSTNIGVNASIGPKIGEKTSLSTGLTGSFMLNSLGDNGYDYGVYAKLSQEFKSEDNVKTKMSAKAKYSFKKEVVKIETVLDVSKTIRMKDNTSKEGLKGQGVRLFSASNNNMYNKPKTFSLPTDPLNLYSLRIGLNFHQGAELQGWTPGLAHNGFISSSFLKNSNERKKKAYGIMNLQFADKKGIMDFQRDDKENPDPKNPFMSMASLTSDIYYVQGIGESSMFKIFRNDFGVVRDPYSNSDVSGDLSLGAEVGYGSKVKVGADLVIAENNTIYGHEPSEFEFGTDPNSFSSTDFFKTYKFLEKGDTSLPLDFEPWIFKELFSNEAMHGYEELQALGYHNPLEAVRAKVGDNLLGYAPDKILENNSGNATNSGSSSIVSYKSNRANGSKYLRSYDLYECLSSGIFNRIESNKIKGLSFANSVIIENLTQFSRNKLEYQINSSGSKKAHHIWEMQLVKDEGSRYVFSTPVYSGLREEYRFNLSKADPYEIQAGGIVEFDPTIVSQSKGRGIDEYFDRKTTPDHAGAFLLNSILSSDYLDLTGNGPTPDDGGVYTLFHYTRTSSDYQWRSPYNENTAFYNEQVKNENDLIESNDRGDDMGAFIYGKRELWYPSSIESKSFEAHFYYSPRADGIGVKGPSGGMNAGLIKQYFNNPSACSNGAFEAAMRSCQMKLDSIIIVSKVNPDKRIKKIGFEYDYSLCKGLPDNIDNYNNSGVFNPSSDIAKGGKLTLKRVWIEHEDSKKGALSDYLFEYGKYFTANGRQNFSNPAFNLSSKDNWGHYRKPNTYFHGVNPDDYSYASQNNSNFEAEETAAWNLTSILTPSGSKLDIVYERDEYAFVQAKNSLLMTPLIGFASEAHGWMPEPDGATGYPWLTNVNGQDEEYLNRRYLYFKIPKDARFSRDRNDKDAALKAAQKCLYNLKDLYASIEVKVKNGESTSIRVPVWWRIYNSYAETDFMPPIEHDLEKAFFYAVNDSVAWIDLEAKRYNDRNYSALSYYKANNGSIDQYGEVRLAAYREAIQQIPWLLHYNPTFLSNPGSLFTDPFGAVVEVIGMIANVFQQLDAAFRSESFAAYMKHQGYCNQMNFNSSRAIEDLGTSGHPINSYLRVNNPFGFKKGDGVRVKSLSVSDNWQTMTNQRGNFNEVYKVEYDYTTTEMYEGEERQISSGVIIDESSSSYDESALLYPIWSITEEEWRNKAVAEFYKPEFKPVLAPLAGNRSTGGVGYSKVTIKQGITGNESRNTKRYTVNEFFTSRDYPHYVEYTSTHLKSNAKDFLTMLMGSLGNSFIYQCASQGFSSVSNNMHGKIKSINEFVQNDGINSPTQQQTFYYSLPKNNKKTIFIRPDGSTEMSYSGVNYEFFFDYRYFCERINQFGVQLNLDVIFVPFPPVLLPVPAPYPKFGRSTITNKAVVANKHIYLTGKLDSTVITGPGFNYVERTIALDANTGQTIISSSNNENNKPIYSSKIPAYWVYPNMGAANQNERIKIPIKHAAGDGRLFAGYDRDDNLLYGNKLGLLFQKVNIGDEVKLLYDNDPINLLSFWIYSVNLPDRSIRLIDKNGAILTLTSANKPDYIEIVKSIRKNLQGVSAGEVVSLENPIASNRFVLNQDKKIIRATALEFSQNWQTDQISKFVNPDNVCNCEEIVFKVNVPISIGNNIPIGLEMIGNSLNALRNRAINQLTAAPIELGNVSSGIRIITTYGDDHQLIFKYFNRNGGQYLGELAIQMRSDLSVFPGLTYNIIKGGDCNNPNALTIKLSYRDGFEVFQDYSYNVQGITHLIPTSNCTYNLQTPVNAGTICEAIEAGGTFNPFVNGTLGNWRLKRSWFYDADRTNIFNIDDRRSPTSELGHYATFNPFWECAAFENASKANWTYANTFEKIHVNGKVYEQKEISGMCSSDLLGYGNNLVEATCMNAKYRNIAFESFEDWELENYETTRVPGFRCKPQNHWFDVKRLVFENRGIARPEVGVAVYDAHTGKNSLAIYTVRTLRINTPISVTPSEPVTDIPAPINIVKKSDLFERFNPEKNKRYLVSMWIKVNDYTSFGEDLYTTYKSAFAVTVNGQALTTKSAIINGWQQLSGVVEVSNGDSDLELIIQNNHINGILIDDMRIHPEEASMISYVYDKDRLKLIAELNNYNFASFVQYDAEGKPVRTKVETEKGIITVNEKHSAMRKRKNPRF